jgi:hypothetical protein
VLRAIAFEQRAAKHIELQLAHSKRDKVSGAYNYAKYMALGLQVFEGRTDEHPEYAY